MQIIFDYTDYRVFLKDYYQFKKETTRYFSHRYFLKKAGLAGPNFLKNVMDGKKNLSAKSVEKFEKALELNSSEAEYFAKLVLYCQAKKVTKKKIYFNDLSHFLTKSVAHTIQKNQLEYFSHWYNIVLREYIHGHPFKGDYVKLAKSIFPKITPKQAEKSVILLEKLGMIKVGSDGAYYLTNPIITTGAEINDIGAYEYHKNMIDISKKALEYIPKEERYFRTITGSYSESTFEKIKMEVEQARNKILQHIKNDSGKKETYQINMHLFPLQSKTRRGRS